MIELHGIYQNKHGSTFEVIDRIKKGVYLIKLVGTEYTKNTNRRSIIEQTVRLPYDKIASGVGYIGLKDNKYTVETSDYPREYKLWCNMIARCYSGKYPTYENVTVCKRWLCFINFLEDLPKIENYELWKNNDNKQVALDKDLKQRHADNKIYSLDTVQFVTKNENMKEVGERQGRAIIAIDSDGNETIYKSIADAAKAMGNVSKGTQKTRYHRIQDALNNGVMRYGYYWKYQ